MAKRAKTRAAATPRKAPAAVAATSRRLKSVGALPPKKNAPEPAPSVAVLPSRTDALAPAPLADLYPLVLGQQLSAQYVANAFRLCTSGYRQQYVDVLGELLEQDPHLFSVLQKRILSTANGRLEVTSAELPDGDPDQALADEVRDLVVREIGRIPDMAQSMAALLWGIYYGISAAEILWSRDAEGWHVDRLGFIHSRRLSYPDMQERALYVWDQGQVYGWSQPFGSTPTNRATFGLRVADYPGKFIVFAPQLRGDYPTRDGVGRETAIWAIFKRVGARGAVEYLERFAKPLMDVTWSTTETGSPREANKEDIALAESIAASIGPGSGSYAAHPNSITLAPINPDGKGTPKVTFLDWESFCDAQMSKAVLGGTLGTDVGKGGGNRALGEVQERGEVDIEQYDATVLAESFRRDVVRWIVQLNRPEGLRVLPRVAIHVDTDPDPKGLLELASMLTKIGAPVDLEDLSDQTGIKLVPNLNPGTPRRSFMSDVVDPTSVDSDLVSDEAKAQKQQALDAQQKIAEAKAKQPAIMPPGAPGEMPPPGKKKGGGGDGGEGSAPASAAPEAAPPKNPAIRSEAEAKDDRKMRLLLSDKGKDQGAATAVYEQLLGDYPAKALDWIIDTSWQGPVLVDLDDVDFSNRDTWRASHEDIGSYVDKVKDGRLKPVVLVKRPGQDKLMIVDGHHRTLAAEYLKRKLLAYVGDVDKATQKKAEELHSMQKKGSSKRGPVRTSRLPSRASSRLPSVSGSILPSYTDTSVLPSYADGGLSVLPSYRAPSR